MCVVAERSTVTGLYHWALTGGENPRHRLAAVARSRAAMAACYKPCNLGSQSLNSGAQSRLCATSSLIRRGDVAVA